MTTFDEREHAFEARFAHDEDLRFRIHARRDRLLGLWAGKKLGKSGDALDDYAMSLVLSEWGRDGEAAVVKKIEMDCAAAGIPLASGELHEKMAHFLAEARAQLLKTS